MNTSMDEAQKEEKPEELTITDIRKEPLEVRAKYARYEIPTWSSLPGCAYGLDVVKQGVCVEHIELSSQPFYLVGRNADVCDISPEHPSISRIHACIQLGKEGRIEIMDFKSTHGSFVNNTQLSPGTYKELHVGDFIQFGGSTRMYNVTGPEEYMQPEQEIVIKDEDRRSKEPVEEAKKVKTSRINIQFLGDRHQLEKDENEMRSKLQEGTWGFDEDANEEENNMSLLGKDFNSRDLNGNEKKQYEKLVQLRQKREKMGNTKKWKNEKEDREGTLGRLDDQIDTIEQSLYDAVEKRKYLESRKRSKRERQLDEEDSYYDRTNVKKKRNTAVGMESREILQEQLSYKKKMMAYYEQQYRENIRKEDQETSTDVLDQFMQDNDQKMQNMKETMLQEKMETLRTDIITITNKIARLASTAPPPSAPLHLKSTARDTSSFTVVEDKPRKKWNDDSEQFIASIGSVIENLTAGNNHSFDNVEARREAPVIKNTVPVTVPRRGSSTEKVTTTTPAVSSNEEKRRDMSEYYVPKNMNVAVNKEALDEVLQEMNAEQPTFMKRIIHDLQGN